MVTRVTYNELEPEDCGEVSHFFAGIGGWPLALQLAGYDGPVWTGSCPCQPFSAAGKQKGTDDERHLWPAWRRLIQQRLPSIVFGEQVASPLGRQWLDAVSLDLEGMGYAVGAADLCAASIGAPHIRQRLWFVAIHRGAVWLADGHEDGRRIVGPRGVHEAGAPRANAARRGAHGRLEHADNERAGRDRGAVSRTQTEGGCERIEVGGLFDRAQLAGATRGFWGGADWLACRDERARPVEPYPRQMADGFSPSLGPVRPNNLEKEIAGAHISEKDAREALRDLWRALAQETIRRSSRRLVSVLEAPVLLAFLRELQREGWGLLDHLPPPCWASPEEGLRALRGVTLETPRASLGRKPKQQRRLESGNALPLVSQIIAREVASKWAIPGFPLSEPVALRVGQVRAYGNAIVPQLAAAFIRAALGVSG